MDRSRWDEPNILDIVWYSCMVSCVIRYNVICQNAGMVVILSHIRLCGQIWEHYARQCSLELAHNMCLNFILSIKMHAADGNYCVDVRTIWAGKQSQEDTCSHVSRSSDTLIIVIEMIMVNFLLARVHWKWNAKLWCFAVVYPIN